MVTPKDVSTLQNSLIFSRIAGITAFVIGCGVLLGWLLDIEALKSVFPGLVSMKPNTAIGIVLSGAALALLTRSRVGQGICYSAAVAAVMVMAIGALTLGEYLLGRNWGIDQWLFTEVPGAVGTFHPGRMSPTTALCFVFSGVALLMSALPAWFEKYYPIVTALGATLLWMGVLTLVTYLLEPRIGYHLWNYPATAVHTATGLVLLGCGLLALVRGNGGLKWSLGMLPTVGFMAATSLIIMVAGVSDYFTLQQYKMAQQVSRSQEVLKEIQDIVVDVANSENFQRGYIIMGDERFLEQFSQTKAKLLINMAEVRKLTTDNPQQQRRLNQIESWTVQWVDWADRTITVRKEQGFTAVQRMVATGTSVALMNNIGQLLKEMQGEESRRLEIQQRQSATTSLAAFMLLPMGMFLSLATLSLVLFSLNAGIGKLVQAEMAMRESEDHFRDLVEHSHDLICTHDLNGQILSVNRAALKLLGYDQKTLLSKNIRDFLCSDFVDQFQQYLETIQQTGLAQGMMAVQTKEGKKLIWEYTNTLRTKGVTVPIVRGMAHDVTEQKRVERVLKASEAELRAVFEPMTDIILVLNDEGRYLKIAPTYPALKYNLSPDRIGKTFHDIFPKEKADFLVSQIRITLDKGRLHRVEYSLDLNGQEFWYDTSISPMSKNSVVWVARDITERKRVELEMLQLNAQIENQRERLNNIVMNIPGNVWETFVEPDGTFQRIDYFSSFIKTILGYSEEESRSTISFWFSIIHPEDKKRVVQVTKSDFAQGKDGRLELRFLAKDGHAVWVELSYVIVKDQEGRPIGLRGVTLDITERKRAELEMSQLNAQIESQRERLNNIVANVPGIVWEVFVESDGITQQVNFVSDYVETMLGYSVEEWLSTPNFWLSILHPEDKERMVQSSKSDFTQGTNARNEFRLLARDGHTVWVESNVIVIKNQEGQPIGLRGVTIDISERKQAEEALHDSEERYRLLFENNPHPMWVFDLETLSILSVNEAAIRHYGYSRQEFLSMTIKDIRPPEGIPVLLDILERGIGMNSELIDSVKHRKKDGTLIDVEITVQRIMFQRKMCIFALAIDVTERLRAEARIHEQAALLNIVQDAIFVTNLDDRILFWNAGAELVYGWSADEVVGKRTSEIFLQDSQSSFKTLAEVHQMIREKGRWQEEIRHVTKDGKEIIADSRWTMVFDQEGKPKSILHVNTDITQKKQLEAQYLRAQRMESIGALAGGIAHDLNNILSPIMMAADLLETKITDPKGSKWLEILRSSTERGTNLVKQILTFARGSESEQELLEVKHVVGEVQKILTETFPKSISLNILIPDDVWNIFGSETQIHQVIMNLCVNARDAMPNGGRLDITLENVMLDEHYSSMKLGITPGPYLLLSVRDTGSGIPPELQEKIFDPFFTTKEIGKGTGLGLPTVLGIVKNHRGFVTVNSEVGKGTQFNVYLPAVKVQPIQNGYEVLDFLHGHQELILVVDDELQICEMTQITLERFGYQVLTANDGAQGVALYAQHQGKIAAVITDMMMPLMDGAATIRMIRKIYPEARFIVTSGFMEGARLVEISSDAKIKFLSKPYTSHHLLIVLHEILTEC